MNIDNPIRTTSLADAIEASWIREVYKINSLISPSPVIWPEHQKLHNYTDSTLKEKLQIKVHKPFWKLVQAQKNTKDVWKKK